MYKFCHWRYVNMSYRDTYQAWLASPALSQAEKAELEAKLGK